MALNLSLQVVTPADIARLQREVNKLDDYFVSAAARSAGDGKTLPQLTTSLTQLSEKNKMNLLDEADRKQLAKDLEEIMAKAPVLHISFAGEPSTEALEKILAWLRDNIDPLVLLRVGLQPAIAAGCVLRTPNKIFDMSVRASLVRSEPLLNKLIAGAANQ